MGLRIGGGVGPLYWSTPIRSPQIPTKYGNMGIVTWSFYISLLMMWWMFYLCWLFYKYLAIAIWWSIKTPFQWWQQRQHAVPPQPVRHFPPGWYQDQANPAYVRWHDGTQWTAHVQLASGPIPPTY